MSEAYFFCINKPICLNSSTPSMVWYNKSNSISSESCQEWVLSPSGTVLLPGNKSQLVWNQTQGSEKFLLFPFPLWLFPIPFPPCYFILCFTLSLNWFTYRTSHYVKTQHFMEALPIALILQLHLLPIYLQTEILDALERIWLKETFSLQTIYNSLH